MALRHTSKPPGSKLQSSSHLKTKPESPFPHSLAPSYPAIESYPIGERQLSSTGPAFYSSACLEASAGLDRDGETHNQQRKLPQRTVHGLSSTNSAKRSGGVAATAPTMQVERSISPSCTASSSDSSDDSSDSDKESSLFPTEMVSSGHYSGCPADASYHSRRVTMNCKLYGKQ
jgi:hypothetical protein